MQNEKLQDKHKKIIAQVMCKLGLTKIFYMREIQEHDITLPLLSLLLSSVNDVNTQDAIFTLLCASLDKIIGCSHVGEKFFLETVIFCFSLECANLNLKSQMSSLTPLRFAWVDYDKFILAGPCAVSTHHE